MIIKTLLGEFQKFFCPYCGTITLEGSNERLGECVHLLFHAGSEDFFYQSQEFKENYELIQKEVEKSGSMLYPEDFFNNNNLINQINLDNWFIFYLQFPDDDYLRAKYPNSTDEIYIGYQYKHPYAEDLKTFLDLNPTEEELWSLARVKTPQEYVKKIVSEDLKWAYTIIVDIVNLHFTRAYVNSHLRRDHIAKASEVVKNINHPDVESIFSEYDRLREKCKLHEERISKLEEGLRTKT